MQIISFEIEKKKFDPRIIIGSFDCDDPSHMLKNCKEGVDFIKDTKRMLECIEKRNGKKRNAHASLFGLCYQRTENHTDDDCNILNDEDDLITDQEPSTIMNQISECVSWSDPDEDSTAYLTEAKFFVYRMRNNMNQFCDA